MTDVLAVEQIDAGTFGTAVVAIGDSVEASVIATGNLLDAGITDLWAKSVSKEHARILQRIGARHVINAEMDAGKRVGHLVSGDYLDYIELEGPHTVVKIHTPAQVVGYSVDDARIHSRYGLRSSLSSPPARNSSTVRKISSCTAMTSWSLWASRTRLTISCAVERGRHRRSRRLRICHRSQ